nr:MAG TPA: Initiation control protein YabA [Caudoviricetes sp.]
MTKTELIAGLIDKSAKLLEENVRLRVELDTIHAACYAAQERIARAGGDPYHYCTVDVHEIHCITGWANDPLQKEMLDSLRRRDASKGEEVLYGDAV